MRARNSAIALMPAPATPTMWMRRGTSRSKSRKSMLMRLRPEVLQHARGRVRAQSTALQLCAWASSLAPLARRAAHDGFSCASHLLDEVGERVGGVGTRDGTGGTAHRVETGGVGEQAREQRVERAGVALVVGYDHCRAGAFQRAGVAHLVVARRTR